MNGPEIHPTAALQRLLAGGTGRDERRQVLRHVVQGCGACGAQLQRYFVRSPGNRRETAGRQIHGAGEARPGTADGADAVALVERLLSLPAAHAQLFAIIDLAMGKLESAWRRLEDLKDLSRQDGRRFDEAHLLDGLAETAAAARAMSSARAYAAEAVDIFTELEIPREAARARHRLTRY